MKLDTVLNQLRNLLRVEGFSFKKPGKDWGQYTLGVGNQKSAQSMSAFLAPAPSKKTYEKPQKWISAGGVVLASPKDYSRIYVRKPSNNYGPLSFPKGKIDKGETQQKAALREVWEEIGVRAALVPGGYLGTGEGGFSITHYYLMEALQDTGRTDMETEEVRIVTWDEALHIFAGAGNVRDLQITTRALALVEKLRKQGKAPK
jgi:8-oxo-dGTP pyrophosphatase MutT (NUDIX family)